jgi:mono/diheme cytochrome c family protein
LNRGDSLKKFLGIVFFMLLLALLAACGNDEQTTSEEPATEETAGSEDSSGNEDSDTTEDPASTSLAGNEVFQQSCITCHSSGDITGGQAKLDGAKIHADFKTKEDLLAFVGKNMPKSAPGSLSQDEYQAVVDYLWDQK